MARPPLTLGKLISRQANNIEETPEGNLSTPSLEARGETYTPPSSISSSYATSASYADFAISASHEIIKEVSSSHADFADTASYVNPLQQDVLLTGSLNISGSLDISMPTGSVFEIHEPDTDQPNRLQFSYSNGDPVLEIGSRSNQGYLHLRKGFTGTGFKIGSDASFEVNGTTEFLMSSTTFQPNATNSKNLGVTNRRFKDVFLYSGAKLGWSANTVADLVSFQHVAGTNTLQATGSSDVTLDVKGDLNVSTNITASGNVSSSAVSTASFGTYLGDGSQLTGISTTPFPFTGDAQITGSLIVSGSFIPTGKTPLSVYNVIIGREAGEIANAQTSYNVFVGGRAGGNDNDFGDQNVLVGYEAGYLGNQTGNTSIGYHAGRGWGTTGATPTTGYNVSVGYQSGYGAATRTTETHNTLLGAFTGRNLTAGSGNTLLGYYAGYNNLGDGNIIIGSGSMGIASMTNQLRIGNGSFHIISGSLETGHIKFNSFDVNGSSRTLFTTASLVYSGSNVTQVTQSYEAGTTQKTSILYSGSFSDGNPLSVTVSGSDGVNKVYTLEYSASLVTQITVI